MPALHSVLHFLSSVAVIFVQCDPRGEGDGAVTPRNMCLNTSFVEFFSGLLQTEQFNLEQWHFI